MKSRRFDIKDKNIKKSVDKNELQLDFRQKAEHFQIVLVLAYLAILPPILVFITFIYDYFSDSRSHLKNEIIWISPFLAAAAVIYFFVLKKRLKMAIIETDFSRKEIGIVINSICQELKWREFINRKNIMVLKTPEEFWSPLAGEQITILFGQNKILVNSIRNLDAQRKAFGEVGKNAGNIKLIKTVIEKTEAQAKNK